MTEWIEISKLTLSEINPREIKKPAFERLKKSLNSENGRRFFEVRPCLVNRRDGKLVVYGGNMRTRAAQDLGWEKVPVILDTISFEEERERTVKDNLVMGEWDTDALANNFEINDLVSWGFDEQEIPTSTASENEEPETPPVPISPRTKQGQIFELGNHRLMCGDSTSEEDVKMLMGGGVEKARLIFTDPPYSVDYESTAGNSYSDGKFHGNKIFNDDKTPDQALEFYKAILKNLDTFSTDDACLYWWFANKMNWINRLAWLESGWYMAQILIWLKEQLIFSIGQDYHRCYEPCMFGWKEGKKHFTNKKLSNWTDVIKLGDKKEFQDYLDIWFEPRDKRNEYVHLTQNPVALAMRGLRKNSAHGDIVIDLFGGSGSTLLACEKLGRKARLMELDPKYCDVIIKRYCNFRGVNEEEIYANAVCLQPEEKEKT